MALLHIHLLGPFQAVLNGEEITDFESDKGRALLAYLAIEANRPHAREALAEMFWPERPERAARGNLRHTLTRLRKSIRDHDAIPGFLEITRQTIGFNLASDFWIDTLAFMESVSGASDPPQDMRHLEKAVELYRGDFL